MPVSTPPIAATATTETIKGAGVGNHTRNMRGKRPMKVVIPINNGTNLLMRAFSHCANFGPYELWSEGGNGETESGI